MSEGGVQKSNSSNEPTLPLRRGETFFRSMLLRNAYPGWLLDRVIKLAISKFVNSNVKCGPRREPLYIGLSFLGKSTTPLRTAILRICKEFIPTKEIIIFHKPGRRISSFFASRTLHRLTCDPVSCMNIRALNVNPATLVKRPDTYGTESQNTLVYRT